MIHFHDKTIVIGAGPGGASAAIYLARFNHEVQLFDAGRTIRGRTDWAYELENVLGFTRPQPGHEYLKDVHAQLHRFGIERREEPVTLVAREPDGSFQVKTAKGAYKAGYLVVAVGVHDLMPDVPDIENYFGHSVFPCPACNWHQTKDRVTAIITNSDRGLVTALAFNDMQPGSARFVIPDRPDAHFTPALRKRVEEEGIQVHTSPLICLNGNGTRLESVTLANGTEITVEILFVRMGIKRHDTFLTDQDLTRDKEGYLQVDFKTFESSVPNLFAVGPCNCGPDQVIISAGQGAVAGLEIHDRILTSHGI